MTRRTSKDAGWWREREVGDAAIQLYYAIMIFK